MTFSMMVLFSVFVLSLIKIGPVSSGEEDAGLIYIRKTKGKDSTTESFLPQWQVMKIPRMFSILFDS